MVAPPWSLITASLSLVLPTQLQQPRSYRKYSSIVIDVENLRGRSGFAVNHAEVLDALSTWSSQQTTARVLLAIDHGHEAQTFLLDDYAILFSGRKKADDTIAQQILPFLCERKVMGKIGIVTADRGLTYRCLTSRHVEIIRPEQILQDLERILQRNLLNAPVGMQSSWGGEDNATAVPAGNETIVPSGNVTDQELALGSELLGIDANLRGGRRGLKNRQRKQLRQRSQTIWRRLQLEFPRMLTRIEDILKNGSDCASVTEELSVLEQRQLLIQWEMAEQFQHSRRRETTEDRIILAERVRQQLLDQKHEPIASLWDAPDKDYFLPKLREDMEEATLHSPDKPTKQQAPPLTLVVLSDTHGMETQLSSPLPDGDILLHLGDFADDGDPKLSMARFDTWLGQQPHKVKVVLRGNHDPRRGFLRNARYITQPETAVFNGYTFVFVPFQSGDYGGRNKMKNNVIPHRYHVLASHVPPYQRLDRCATGKCVGSKTLAKATAKNPPLLWLCGHIHEGRGILQDTAAGGDRTTTIINAANANSGKASCLAYGPTVVQLNGGRTVSLLHMDGPLAFMNQDNAAFFATKILAGCAPLLMAVDLGLRTGVCLLDQQGRILQYAQFHYDTTDALCKGAEKLLKEWQEEYNRVNGAYISHLAIEGSDPPVLDAWRTAASKLRRPPAILYVRPEEWRSDMLSHADQQSGALAKEASERLAEALLHQQEQDSGGAVATDVAESILLGVHVARRLGWVTKDVQQQLVSAAPAAL